MKPQTHCVCSFVQPLAHHCAVTVLQHPRERRHPIGTARLLRLGLKNSQLHVCHALAAPAALAEQLAQPGTALLFPHPRAQALAAKRTQVQHLVLLDGTWSQARSLYRHNAWLHALLHVEIASDGIDRYRIRREPKPTYTSTIEAVVRALQAVEDNPQPFEHLLVAFERMIAAQMCSSQAPRSGPRRCKKRARRCQLPARYTDTQKEQVLVACESIATDSPGSIGSRRLVCLAALRRDTGAIFCMAQQWTPQNAAEQLCLAHMGLPHSFVQAGSERAQLQAAFAAFCPQQPTLIGWNQTAINLAYDSLQGHKTATTLSLKTLYCNHWRRQSGHLEDILARHGRVPTKRSCPGRVGGRLAAAHGLVVLLDSDGLVPVLQA